MAKQENYSAGGVSGLLQAKSGKSEAFSIFAFLPFFGWLEAMYCASTLASPHLSSATSYYFTIRRITYDEVLAACREAVHLVSSTSPELPLLASIASQAEDTFHLDTVLKCLANETQRARAGDLATTFRPKSCHRRKGTGICRR